jgi:putative transposase
MNNLARRIFSMKRSRFTEQQIAFALQQAEQGIQVAEVTRKMGISEQTFYRSKKKFGGLMPSEVRKLRQLEEENARLRHDPEFTVHLLSWTD